MVEIEHKTIAVVRRLPQSLIDALAPHARVIVAPTEGGLDKAGCAALLRGADAALVTALDVVDEELIVASPRLKLIANIGVGYNNIDVPAAQARGISVTNTPGAMDGAVADLAMALMLGAARRLPQADAFVRSRRWTSDNLTGFGMGLDVSGKTLGIVGFGRIGQTLAKRAAGFDMNVIYTARRPVDSAIEEKLGVRHAVLEELLARSDFVVLLVPYSAETHHLIGAPQLSRMKPSAVLVNVARGGIVDDGALAAALNEGRLAGAALDCVENEPYVLPDLARASNVIFTPHIGSATPATRMTMAGMAIRNLIAWLQGGSPPNLVPAT